MKTVNCLNFCWTAFVMLCWVGENNPDVSYHKHNASIYAIGVDSEKSFSLQVKTIASTKQLGVDACL